MDLQSSNCCLATSETGIGSDSSAASSSRSKGLAKDQRRSMSRGVIPILRMGVLLRQSSANGNISSHSAG